jgi:50S ribosomal protein L16 3-hydroxylase
MTYSIGFRAPSHQELGEQFLVHLQDQLCLDGMYADPNLQLQQHPSEISTDMLQQVAQTIQKIKWDNADIANFLGRYLSEPKPHIFFDAPEAPWTYKRFQQAVSMSGIALDLKTQMLCHHTTVFINGESHPLDSDGYICLRQLADNRQLNPKTKLPTSALDLLYQWYQDGYLQPVR